MNLRWAGLVFGNEGVADDAACKCVEVGVHLVLAPEEMNGAIRPFVEVDLPQRS